MEQLPPPGCDHTEAQDWQPWLPRERCGLRAEAGAGQRQPGREGRKLAKRITKKEGARAGAGKGKARVVAAPCKRACQRLGYLHNVEIDAFMVQMHQYLCEREECTRSGLTCQEIDDQLDRLMAWLGPLGG